MKDFLCSGAVLSLSSDSVWIAWGDSTWQRKGGPSAQGESVFFPDFFLSDRTPWGIPRRAERWHVQGLIEALLNEVGGDSGLRWKEPELAEFEGQFQSLKSEFVQGRLRKGVPVVFADALHRVTPGSRARWLVALLRAAQAAPVRVYGYWDENEGMLGATPEDLFVLAPDGEVQTMALAGTARREIGPAILPSILDDPKERREHALVIEDLRETLSSLGSVEVGETGVLELPSLVHLKTPVRARVQVGFEELARRLHPTAALGAFPREEGWKWLQAHTSGRGRFGAPFGVYSAGGASVCVVAIRNVQWSASRVRLGSGCGVIAESVLENEWAELASKRESVRRMMGV